MVLVRATKQLPIDAKPMGADTDRDGDFRVSSTARTVSPSLSLLPPGLWILTYAAFGAGLSGPGARGILVAWQDEETRGSRAGAADTAGCRDQLEPKHQHACARGRRRVMTRSIRSTRVRGARP